MPVPSTINDISTNPADNFPAGSESVFPSLDDYLRTVFAFIAQVREGPILPTAIPDGSLTLAKLASAIQNGLAQVGDFKWKLGNNPDPGWLVLSGSTQSRTDQAKLWAYAQTSGMLAASEAAKQGGQFGPGNGNTTFTLPNILGEFIRAVDLGRGVDPGRWLGSNQDHQFQSHQHTGETDVQGAHAHRVVPPWSSNDGGGGRTASGSSDSPYEPVDEYWTEESGAHQHWFTTSSVGGNETRPRNVALLPCVFTGL